MELMIKCLNSIFDELTEVKYPLKKMKCLKSLQVKAEAFNLSEYLQ